MFNTLHFRCVIRKKRSRLGGQESNLDPNCTISLFWFSYGYNLALLQNWEYLLGDSLLPLLLDKLSNRHAICCAFISCTKHFIRIWTTTYLSTSRISRCKRYKRTVFSLKKNLISRTRIRILHMFLFYMLIFILSHKFEF